MEFPDKREPLFGLRVALSARGIAKRTIGGTKRTNTCAAGRAKVLLHLSGLIRATQTGTVTQPRTDLLTATIPVTRITGQTMAGAGHGYSGKNTEGNNDDCHMKFHKLFPFVHYTPPHRKTSQVTHLGRMVYNIWRWRKPMPCW